MDRHGTRKPGRLPVLDRARRALAAVVVGAWTALGACSVGAQPYVAAAFSKTDFKVDAGPGLSGSPTGSLYFGAGYRFTRHVALEASWLDSGSDLTATGATTAAGPSRFTTSYFWNARGPGLTAIGALPLSERFTIEGRVGAHRLTSTLRSQTLETPSRAVTVHEAQRRTFWAPGVGLAAHYEVTDGIRLGLLVQEIRGGELERLRMRSVVASYAF